MKKILLFWLLTCCAVCLPAQNAIGLDEELINLSRKLLMAESAISRMYVDEVNEDKMVEEAVRAMLKQLDPHSTYSTPKEVKALKESLNGNFDGIGVQFNMVEDTLFVVQTIAGGPSEKAGIMAGDRIIMVNDTAIAGVKMDREDIMTRLRGPKGTEVKITVLRRGVSRLLPFQIVRDKISTQSVDVAFMANKRTGFIRIANFGATTHQEFVNSVDSLQRLGMKDLIIDLQGNGGGYLNAAVNIANEFLNEGEEIVYTQGRVFPRYDYKAVGKGRFSSKGRVVILVDETTASASEILSGAIQDWDRGLVVGRRTFGKGLVQRPVDLPDGSMIRLTIARYYTPSGRCIQRAYTDKKKYEQDLMSRYDKGELMNEDSIHFPDSLRYQTLKLQRTVYGGGGIMPDYFVPLDTARYTKYHRDLAAKGCIISASLRFVDMHRDAIKSEYSSFEDFNRRFELPDYVMEELQRMGNKDSVVVSPELFAASLPSIKLQLKALIARDIWDMNAYYTAMLPMNDAAQKALELMAKPEFEELLKKKK